MVTDDFYFIKNLELPDEQLVAIKPNNYSKQQQDSIKRKLSVFTSAFYETARWMIMNNKKE